MASRQCLQCGMPVSPGTEHCPKCGSRLDQQTDGSTVTVDIAHQGERVHEALKKMHAAIAEEKTGPAQYLRIVVGGGTIRQAAEEALITLAHRQAIKSYNPDGRNPGAFMVRLR